MTIFPLQINYKSTFLIVKCFFFAILKEQEQIITGFISYEDAIEFSK